MNSQEKFAKLFIDPKYQKLKEYFSRNPKYCDDVAIGHTVYLEAAKKTKAAFAIPSNNDMTNGIIYELLIK